MAEIHDCSALTRKRFKGQGLLARHSRVPTKRAQNIFNIAKLRANQPTADSSHIDVYSPIAEPEAGRESDIFISLIIRQSILMYSFAV